MATLNVDVSRTKDIDSYILQSVDTQRTGLADDLKIRGLDENPPASLCPTCNAADLLAANSAQKAQEHFVEGADLTLFRKELSDLCATFAYFVFLKVLCNHKKYHCLSS